MKSSFWRTVVGVFLLLLGAVFMVQQFVNLSFFQGFGSAFFGLLFVVLGGSFLYVLVKNRQKWWAAIPGFTLLGLGVTVFIGEIPGFIGDLGGSIFLGSIGISFLVVYIIKRDFWWALLPGFIMLGIAAATGLEELNLKFINGDLTGALILGGIGISFLVVYFVRRNFWWAIIPAGSMLSIAMLVAFDNVAFLFLGLGVTFAVVALLPAGFGEKMNWAWIPSGILFALGVVFYISTAVAGAIGNILLPVILIIVGGFILFRSIFRR